MLKKLIIGLAIAIILILAGGYGYYRIVVFKPLPISPEDRATITLMPLPARLELKEGAVDLSNGFNRKRDGSRCSFPP